MSRSEGPPTTAAAGLASHLADLSRVLLAPSTVTQTLHRIVMLSVATIDGCDAAGLWPGTGERPMGQPLALVAELDELQGLLGEGPCLDVLAGLDSLYVTDVTKDSRWPRFSAAAADAGLRSILAYRLSAGTDTLGVLQLYGQLPGAFNATDRAQGLLLAAHAGVALAVSQTQAAGPGRVDHLDAAMRSRESIGQAQGILMEREHITAGQAFALLRRSSQHLNVKLSDIAQELVDTGASDPERQTPLACSDASAELPHGLLLERRAPLRAKQAEQVRATLLATVTSELAGTLDAQEAGHRLAKIVVPALADWCLVTVIDDDAPGPDWRRLRDIGWWHGDPTLSPFVERVAAVRPGVLTDHAVLNEALTSGQHVVLPPHAVEDAVAALEPGEVRELITQLAPASALVLPLRAHGRTLGMLTLFFSADTTKAGARDLDLAREVATLAGLALDNVRLFGEQQRLAEGLQRSLLTTPPEPDHCHVVVRYQPAADAAQVGGDWYDAFMQEDGATVLVIGDVVGHDTQAAAAMGQLRALLRGIAAGTGDSPAGVLTRLDKAMALLQVDTAASVVVARFEQTPDELERGITHMRWSNAGHPPPFALHPHGTVTVLAGSSGQDADLLLGIDPTATRTENEVTLERGTTVLLFTDGLVERHGQALDEGLAKLADTLADLAGHNLDELCDHLLTRMLPRASDDDVALAAIRLHPRDEPRPAQAGPTHCRP